MVESCDPNRTGRYTWFSPIRHFSFPLVSSIRSLTFIDWHNNWRNSRWLSSLFYRFFYLEPKPHTYIISQTCSRPSLYRDPSFDLTLRNFTLNLLCFICTRLQKVLVNRDFRCTRSSQKRNETWEKRIGLRGCYNGLNELKKRRASPGTGKEGS